MYGAQTHFDFGADLTPGPLTPPPPPHSQPSLDERLFMAQKCSLYFASELFAAGLPRRRRACHNLPLSAVTSKQVSFSGERLDQTDLDVLLALTAISRGAGERPGALFRTAAGEIMDELGWAHGKRDGKRLMDALNRLESAHLLIRSIRYSCHTKLVNKVLINHRSGDLVVALDEAVQSVLLRSDRFPTFLRERREIGDAPLARWLHGLSWSMNGAFCVEIERLHRLSGLGNEMTADDFFVRAAAELRRLEDRGLIGHFERLGESRLIISYRAEVQKFDRCRMVL